MSSHMHKRHQTVHRWMLLRSSGALALCPGLGECSTFSTAEGHQRNEYNRRSTLARDESAFFSSSSSIVIVHRMTYHTTGTMRPRPLQKVAMKLQRTSFQNSGFRVCLLRNFCTPFCLRGLITFSRIQEST